jgi:hypothetical protein
MTKKPLTNKTLSTRPGIVASAGEEWSAIPPLGDLRVPTLRPSRTYAAGHPRERRPRGQTPWPRWHLVLGL